MQEFGIDELTAETVGLCFVTKGQMSTALLTHLGEEPLSISATFLFHFRNISAASFASFLHISELFYLAFLVHF